MKAIVYCEYGAPDVLKLESIAKPVPSDTQVLVKVRAASVNPLDWHMMRGEPRSCGSASDCESRRVHASASTCRDGGRRRQERHTV
jgi:NADPH:quinone reductase-like Zn-dependent oxidoreductase